jgi:hypothetical protein
VSVTGVDVSKLGAAEPAGLADTATPLDEAGWLAATDGVACPLPGTQAADSATTATSAISPLDPTMVMPPLHL